MTSLAVPRSVLANGGVTQLDRQPAGPYLLSVTTSPTPLRTGTGDVSVLVERSDTQDIVLDAQVSVAAEPILGNRSAVLFSATHDQAINKLLYSANVDLTESGRWQFVVQVAGNLGDATAAFQTNVAEPSIFDDQHLIPIAVGLVIVLIVFWSLRLPKRGGGSPPP